MKKKLFALALLTASASTFAAPISTPVNVSDTPIIGGNNGTCGTVDLTNATSDYELKPCETAVIRFDNQQYIPLHVKVPEPPSPSQPVMYEITVAAYWVLNKNIDIAILPNNITYPQQFQVMSYLHGVPGWFNLQLNQNYNWPTDRFWFDTYYGHIDTTPYLGTFKAIYYGASYPKHMTYEAFDNLSISLASVVWDNKATQWTSLGTFMDANSPMSGQIIIKRIS